LQGRLTAAGYTPAAVETALLALEAAGFLDDRRYAEHFVAYHAGRGQGPRRIRSGLRGKGLSVELATLAVDDTSAVWGQRAQDLRRRRFGVEAPASFAERARQSRFLLYRGFTPAQVRQAFAADQVDLHDLDLEAVVPEDSAHED
jgi:regulatory protein